MASFNSFLTRLKSFPKFDVFSKKGKYKYRVLISYLAYPFRKISFTHFNQLEVLGIAEVFDELGFIVDLYDFRFPLVLKLSKYDVIFGFGPCFEKAVKKQKTNQLYIAYQTGSFFCFSNISEIKRLKELYKRKKILLKPKRIVPHLYYTFVFSDAIILIGNDITLATHSLIDNIPIYKLQAPIKIFFDPYKINRNISIAKKKFIWFGSLGAVHKGLDLCLETFARLPHLNLHICGNIEKNFLKLYKKELSLPNIHYHKFVNIKSEKFRELMQKCMFTILPSCSEGQSTGLLVTMGMGLIPLATKFVGVDLNGKGFFINNNINDITKIVLKCTTIEDKNLYLLSIKNIEYVKKFHNYELFKKNLKKYIIDILKKKHFF